MNNITHLFYTDTKPTSESNRQIKTHTTMASDTNDDTNDDINIDKDNLIDVDRLAKLANDKMPADVRFNDLENLERKMDSHQKMVLVAVVIKNLRGHDTALPDDCDLAVWLKQKLAEMTQHIVTFKQWDLWFLCIQLVHFRIANFRLQASCLKQSLVCLSNDDLRRVKNCFLENLAIWYETRSQWAYPESCTLLTKHKDTFGIVADVIGDISTIATDGLNGRRLLATPNSQWNWDSHVFDIWRQRLEAKQKVVDILRQCLVETGFVCKDICEHVIAPFVW